LNLLLLLPVLIPLVTAIIAIFNWRSLRMQRIVNVAGAALLLAAGATLLGVVWSGGIHAVQIGNWPAPFGITFVADLLSAIMVTLAGITGTAVAVYSLVTVDSRREHFGYYPLFHVLLMGICGAFLTGDMFNLFVWFEVMLIASFVLLALGGRQAQLEGAIKYVTLNLLSSALFLAAVGLLYGATGTLNMAHLARILPTLGSPGLITTIAMLFLASFGIKAAVFPLFFWLPASYHTPPVAVSAIFAGMLTKVGVYALLRVFTLIFTSETDYTHTLLLIIAALTMVTGVLGAAAQNEIRRILSFHIVSQIGYMIMGLALYTPLGIAGAVFYIIHHIVVKTNLFLISGIIQRIGGSFQLRDLGGLYASHPGLAFLFLIAALSLAGIPPLSGFWAKLTLVRAGIETSQYAVVAVALIVSLLTLFSMTKIWAGAFWKKRPEHADEQVQPAPADPPGRKAMLYGPAAALAAITMLIGIGAQPVFALASRTAMQLLDRMEYINAVLGEVN